MSWGFEQEESTPMPVMWCVVPADQVQMSAYPVQGSMNYYSPNAPGTQGPVTQVTPMSMAQGPMTQGMTQGWWQAAPMQQMPQMLPLQPVQAAQVQSPPPLPMHSAPQMAGSASEVPMDGQSVAWIQKVAV